MGGEEEVDTDTDRRRNREDKRQTGKHFGSIVGGEIFCIFCSERPGRRGWVIENFIPMKP
jgi:hypothetical protein